MEPTVPTSDPDEPRPAWVGRTPPRADDPERRRSSDPTGWAVAPLALAAAVGALFAEVHPTGWIPADLVLPAAFAALVTVAASMARRWACLVLAGVAALGARDPATLVLAAAAVGVAFAGAVSADRRVRGAGALVGATAVQVLLRLPDWRYQGATSLVAAVAVAPVLISAYRVGSRRTRRVVRRATLAVGALALVATAAFGIAVLEGRRQMTAAVSDARAGLEAARSGDEDVAVARLRSARDEFAAASDGFAAWWVQPARSVPLVSQHAEAARAMADAGTDLADAAATAASSARYEDLKASAGQVNLPLLTSMRPSVHRAVEALERAEASLGAVPADWLLPPLAGPLDDLKGEVAEALPQARTAELAVEAAPGLLGEGRVRSYLILFGTPAETRGLGGFVGAWAVLEARDGKLSLRDSGSILELSNRPDAASRTLSGPADYVSRYSRWVPTRYLQNVTLSPDFPTVARVARELFGQAGLPSVDGVVYVDPAGLAALLELTGPVRVPGLAEPLTAGNVEEFLLRQQYVQFPDTDERRDLLIEAGRATFDALTSRDLPGPNKLGEVLGPAVAAGRLRFEAFDPATHALLDRLGTRGAFPAADRGDVVAFRQSNGGANKIDAYLRRELRYDVTVDPATATVDGSLEVVLHNDAPATGLPPYVLRANAAQIGAPPAAPDGTNVTEFTLYSPLPLEEATLDGEPLPIQAERELGLSTYSNRIQIAPQSSARLRFRLRGPLRDTGTYRLAVVPQALATADRYVVEVHGAPGWVPAEGAVTRVEGPQEELVELVVPFRAG